MNATDLELWQRISLFQFDKPNVKLTFAKRLARENSLSEQFSCQIIEEYKKFLFLCCVSSHQVTPSHFVDLAWHLHLTYTKSYWIDLCKNTLYREIHHNPTEGGKSENVKFVNYYTKTIQLYQTYFGVKPLSTIWQDNDERFAVRITNVDKRKNWIIPKPTFWGNNTVYLFIAIFFVPVIFVSCQNNSLIDISVLAIFLFIVLIIFFLSARRRKEKRERKEVNDGSGCGSTIDHTPGSGGHTHSHGHDTNDSGDSSGSDGGGGDGGCSSGCGGGGD
jgi:hypothetical protein